MQIQSCKSTSEFFYDISFDDYQKIYLIEFDKSAISKDTHITYADDIYITLSKPDGQLRLTDIIGVFYIKGIDARGVYGAFKVLEHGYIDNDTLDVIMTKYSLRAFGISDNTRGPITNYRILSVYADPKSN